MNVAVLWGSCRITFPHILYTKHGCSILYSHWVIPCYIAAPEKNDKELQLQEHFHLELNK